MKSLIIKNDEIDYELFEKIASFLDKYDENEVLAIWLSSRGGVCSVTEAIRDLLESDERVVLIAYDMISSSALDLFLSTNCAKTLTDGTVACFHKSFYPTVKVIKDSRTPMFGRQESLVGEIYRSESDTDKHVKNFLSDEELESYEKGEDIWLNYQRLKEIYENLTQ